MYDDGEIRMKHPHMMLEDPSLQALDNAQDNKDSLVNGNVAYLLLVC